MTRPIFSEKLDADPTVKAWLASLDDATRAELKDDATPLFKETGAIDPEDVADVDVDTLAAEGPNENEGAEREVLDAIDALRATTQGEFFPEMSKGARGVILAAARKHLPDWKFKAFSAWFDGKRKARIARELGVSVSTVRSALDGQGTTAGAKRAGPGALAALLADDDFRKVVVEMAAKAKRPDRDMRMLDWFAGLRGVECTPAMVVAYAYLIVLDYLADAKREVKVQDTLPHFPRNLITPCLQILRGEGLASSDGLTIRIHALPKKKEFK